MEKTQGFSSIFLCQLIPVTVFIWFFTQTFKLDILSMQVLMRTVCRHQYFLEIDKKKKTRSVYTATKLFCNSTTICHLFCHYQFWYFYIITLTIFELFHAALRKIYIIGYQFAIRYWVLGWDALFYYCSKWMNKKLFVVKSFESACCRRMYLILKAHSLYIEKKTMGNCLPEALLRKLLQDLQKRVEDSNTFLESESKVQITQTCRSRRRHFRAVEIEVSDYRLPSLDFLKFPCLNSKLYKQFFFSKALGNTFLILLSFACVLFWP